MATVTLKNPGGVELTVHDREFVVLTGPDNAGSALVRSIAGLADVSQGEIFCDEKRINDVPAKDRDAALLSHDYVPYPVMSVYQNLTVGLELRKFGDAEIKKRVAGVTEILGLQNQLAASPGSLSAEQRRLVGLGRVMVRQPKVYLFDEPFRDLGRQAASQSRAAIAELRQRASATMIYATTEATEALALGARTVVLDAAGGIQQDAAAQLIFDEPANVFVARFFGDQPMNLVQGTVRQERGALTFSETGDGTIAIPLPASRFPQANALVGQALILGFRPDAVEIAQGPGDNSSGTAFRGLVDNIELRGWETDLYLRTGAHKLICRSRRRAAREEAGRRAQFEIQLEKAHLFDAVSGCRLMQSQ
jgi:multiple sugar transport system ATP-binding protein